MLTAQKVAADDAVGANPHRIPEGLPGAGNFPVFNNGDEFEGLYRDYSSAVGSVSF